MGMNGHKGGVVIAPRKLETSFVCIFFCVCSVFCSSLYEMRYHRGRERMHASSVQGHVAAPCKVTA